MTDMISWIYTEAEHSSIIDPKHLWTIIPAAVVTPILLLDIDILIGTVTEITQQRHVMWFLQSSFQGLAAGLLPSFIYTINNRSFQVSRIMLTKERALIAVVSVTIGVGWVVNSLVPKLISKFPYPGIQLFGACVFLGFGYVHFLVEHWKLENEAPHFLSSFVLFVAPFLT